ncbi:MAG TPA: hypothetical protein PKX38_07565 [Alphaproteobacteria bacterium]|nr:hypothetical protein [Micavibrio sp.]HQX27779.1 hypothetical protein [Alphaproteobacteria bacterium]
MSRFIASVNFVAIDDQFKQRIGFIIAQFYMTIRYMCFDNAIIRGVSEMAVGQIHPARIQRATLPMRRIG